MGLFKKASKMFHKATDTGAKLFNKGVGDVKLFGKGSDGSKALGGFSKGLRQTGSVMGSAGRIVSAVANNPLVGAIASTNPYTATALEGAKGLGAGLTAGSKVAKFGAEATRQKNYGNAQGVSNILERAKAMHDSGAGISFV